MSDERDGVLESWEAVVPGIVLPPLALWLAGGTWADRGLAAAANTAPLVVLVLLAWWGGRRSSSVQGAATLAYGITALGWVGATWELGFLALPGAHAELWTPVVAAGVAIFVFLAVWFIGGSPADSPSSE